MDLVILTKLKKGKNQLDTDFDMEVFQWKETVKTFFIRRHNIEEGNNKL